MQLLKIETIDHGYVSMAHNKFHGIRYNVPNLYIIRCSMLHLSPWFGPEWMIGLLGGWGSTTPKFQS
jgi:hypothetical protein